jgi:hypothetical protein
MIFRRDRDQTGARQDAEASMARPISTSLAPRVAGRAQTLTIELRNQRVLRPLVYFIRRGRIGRQLQYGRVLTFAQSRQQHDLPVRKFQRVVMCVRFIELDLTELGRAPLDFALWQNAEEIVVFDVVLEYQFGAGPQAHRYVGFSNSGKATGGGVVESRRHQLVSYLRRPGFDEMQTEIAHGN